MLHPAAQASCTPTQGWVGMRPHQLSARLTLAPCLAMSLPPQRGDAPFLTLLDEPRLLMHSRALDKGVSLV